MRDLTTTYRGFKLEIEKMTGAFLAHVISLTGARFLVSATTAFGAAENAFDLIDDLLEGR